VPIIKVWCLPANQTEEKLQKLHKTIVGAVVSVSKLGLKDQNDMTCLFPPDLMKYGLGEEIIIEVTGLFEKPNRTNEVFRELAKKLGESVHELYPYARVECFIQSFNPMQGFWTSAEILR